MHLRQCKTIQPLLISQQLSSAKLLLTISDVHPFIHSFVNSQCLSTIPNHQPSWPQSTQILAASCCLKAPPSAIGMEPTLQSSIAYLSFTTYPEAFEHTLSPCAENLPAPFYSYSLLSLALKLPTPRSSHQRARRLLRPPIQPSFSTSVSASASPWLSMLGCSSGSAGDYSIQRSLLACAWLERCHTFVVFSLPFRRSWAVSQRLEWLLLSSPAP